MPYDSPVFLYKITTDFSKNNLIFAGGMVA